MTGMAFYSTNERIFPLAQHRWLVKCGACIPIGGLAAATQKIPVDKFRVKGAPMPLALTNTQAVLAIITSTFGTGILFMPSGFAQLGYAYASMVLLAMPGCISFSLFALAFCAVMTESTKGGASYSALAGAFSKRLKLLIDLSMVGRNLGIMLVLTRYFCVYAARALQAFGVPGSTAVLEHLCLLFFVLLVGYYSMKTSLASLAFMQKISFAGVLLYIVLLCYYALAVGAAPKPMVAFGTVRSSYVIKFVFAMHCQYGFLSIFNEMADQGLQNALGLLVGTSMAIAFIYGFTGFLGGYVFGSLLGDKQILEILMDKAHPCMQRLALLTFDKKNLLPLLPCVCFLFIWFNFVIMALFPMFKVIEERASFCSRSSARTFAVLAAVAYLVGGTLIPGLPLNKLLSFCSAAFTNPLSFLYPAVFFLLVSTKVWYMNAFAVFLICASLYLMFSVFYEMVVY
ncbi:hypothetical protein PAPHI01_1612 [Pancytospora philotis]|nr:hypothetical protein PAPHI01_1612 [Pancytospora philotis]